MRAKNGGGGDEAKTKLRGGNVARKIHRQGVRYSMEALSVGFILTDKHTEINEMFNEGCQSLEPIQCV